MEAFRQGRKDVLVATDVASKGLDFAEVQHVINYDMPDDVENYGECGLDFTNQGKSGLTFKVKCYFNLTSSHQIKGFDCIPGVLIGFNWITKG